MRVNKGWKYGRKNSRKIEWKIRGKEVEEKIFKWNIEFKGIKPGTFSLKEQC